MIYNVAIFPAGTEIGLEINNALKFVKNINIIGFNNVPDHTRFVYSSYVDNLPYYNEKDFLEKLNMAIKKYKIDYIYPAHDDILLFLTLHQSEINAHIITSDTNTVDICRSKAKTYDYFRDEKFMPKVYKNINDVDEYPVFIKPNIGQGSKGAKLVNNYNELTYEYNLCNDIVIVEYLPGNEYTVDCFTDLNGQLKYIGPRVRNRIKSGISVNTSNIELTNDIKYIANTINSKLKFNGAWFFQLKRDVFGNYKLLEIAARIPGTMGLSRNRGINFPLLTIYNHLGVDTQVIGNDYNIELDRAFINRYKLSIEFDTVYIDFDDTIIVKGYVNCYVMFFLYQCINEQKKLILLTKHKNDIYESLSKYKISETIFDDIVNISDSQEKSDYITNFNSIFIDDSFAERSKVHEIKKIPTFDLDEIEALMDWKIKNNKDNEV